MPSPTFLAPQTATPTAAAFFTPREKDLEEELEDDLDEEDLEDEPPRPPLFP